MPAQAQFRESKRPALPDFDSRTNAVPDAKRVAERQTGQAHLAGLLPAAVVEFDPLLDTPQFIRTRNGFLTGPNGQGGAVAAAATQAQPAADSLRPLKAFLNEHSALFGHGAEALDTAAVKRDYVDAHNGLHTIVWEQELDGIPVYQSLLVGHITKKGELTSLESRFLPDLATAADTGTPARAAVQAAPPISATQAILLAGQNIGAGLTAASITPAGGPVGGYLLYQTPKQASVRLVWLPLGRSALRLAWEALVTKSGGYESYRLLVDAQTGRVYLREDLTCHISNATYVVYDQSSPSPFAPSLQTPSNFQPPLTNRVTITTPALDTIASPDGWIPDGGNTTTGNNIDAFVDRNFDEQPDQARPVGNPTRVFNFPLDLTLDPTNYIDGSTVQLFWRGNWYHDRLYEFGFTEAAGNYQDNTFGRGGVGNDHIICFVQSGADLGIADNSMFASAPDGQSGRCYMFIFDFPNPYRDGSLDQEVVTHELTHGTSTRLVGGGMVLGALQSRGLGEGWSDFYATALLNPTNANPDAAYASGGYASYAFAGLDQNYYYGIRRYPYCTDMSKNPLTFKDIDPAQALAHTGVPLSPLFSPFDAASADEVHNQGEVWCVTLWELHAKLVHKYGWAIGNELVLQLTTDGMKLTPAFPNFLQARDAILLADQIDNAGANTTEIWQAFAKRGMGASATSPASSTTAGIQEAYDVPIISSVKLGVHGYQIFGGNGNGIIEFDECNSFNLALTNTGTVDVTGISVTLVTTTPGAAIAQSTSAYADLPMGSTGTNLAPFKISTSPSFVCGTPIELSVLISTYQGQAFSQITLPTGTPGTPLRFDNNSFVPIPSPGTGSSFVAVSNVNSAINNLTVSMYVTEPIDFFLSLVLVAPDGTTNLLSANNGLLGSDYGSACSPDGQRTTFDDAALTSIAAGSPPFVGSFRPAQPLSTFIGKAGSGVNGLWELRAIDQGQSVFAVIQCWSLFITPTLCTDGGGQCPGSDMALSMTAQPSPFIAGKNLSYVIAVTNLGPSPATSAVVTHLLPPSVTLVSVNTSQGTFALQGDVITFNLGPMGIRGTANITVTVQPTEPGTIVSTATASSEQPDFNPGNNSVTVSSLVTPATADLNVAIAAVPNPVLIGGTLTYTVSVTNNGPSPASLINVTNVLPINSRIQSTTVSQGTFNAIGNVVLWNLSRLAMGASATATITVTPTAEGIITASVTGTAAQFDPIAVNNTASISTSVGAAADLGITLGAFPNPVVAGSNVTYTIAVTNPGPSAATGVIVSDVLPSPVNVLTNFATQGSVTISNSFLTWNLGSLSSGASASLTVVVRTTANGTLSTTATVQATQADPNTSNNTASSTTVVAAPFITIVPAGASLTQESGPTNGAIDLGETVTMTLYLRNGGNVSTSNLVATLLATNGVVPVPPNSPQILGSVPASSDPVSASFSFTAHGVNGGSISPTLQLRDGSVSYPLVSYTFTLPTTQVSANPSLILVPDPTLPDPPYPVGSGPATPYPSVIPVSNFSGVLGNVTVTLSNLNHSYPSDVNVLLVAPGGAKTLLMSHAGDQDQSSAGLNLTFDDLASAGPLPESGQLSSGTWRPAAYTDVTPTPTFPSNAPAGPYPVSLAALNGINPNGTWSLYVFDDSTGDVGAISNGWSLNLTSIVPINQLADLGLTALVKPNSGLVGGILTYTFTVTNGGPNTATFVGFTNNLPAGTTLVSAGSSQGNVITNPSSVIVSLGTLNAGTVATVTNVVRLTSAALPPGVTNGTITSVANVAAQENDLNPVNSTISVVTAVSRPVADLGLTQTVAPDPVVVGYNLTNTLVITNRGPRTAPSVFLTEALPPGVGFNAANSSTTAGTITANNGVVTCALGDLVSNTTATVLIVLTNSAPGLMTNTASLSAGSYDPTPADATANYVATVVNPSAQIVSAGATLTYESGPVNGVIDAGETVNLSLALANTGTLDTADLTATLLPSGGVTSPSGPQDYGALIYGGPSVSRSFSFKAASEVSGGIVATLQIRDGNTDLGVIDFAFGAGVTTNVFSSAAINIPDHGTAGPYPSTINVSGVSGRVSSLTLGLNGLTHSFPHDLSLLLVSPSGSNVLVMSHTGGAYALTNVNLVLDDSAAVSLPNYGLITAGTYKPSSYEGPVVMPGPAPAGRYQSALSGMVWSNPNGAWSLFVYDDKFGDSGVILNGWTLSLSTLVTVGPVNDLVVGMSVPASLNVGSALTNTITIANFGPDTATGILLTNTLPAGVQFVSATLSQGSVTGSKGGEVTCNLGNLAVGASAKVIIVTMPSAAGSLLNAVNVVANEEDLVPANNSAQGTTTVYVPAILSGVFSGGFFQLTVTGQPDAQYIVQASSNLTSWVSLSTTSSPTGTFTYTDTTTPTPQLRFYRTLRP
jgi:uncharacterized repeat protein (TIGR01451 family)